MDLTEEDKENLKYLMDIVNHVEFMAGNAVVDTHYMSFLKSKILLATVLYYFESHPDILLNVGLTYTDGYFYYNNMYLSWKSNNSLFKFQHFWKVG